MDFGPLELFREESNRVPFIYVPLQLRKDTPECYV